jgi:sugar phosphate isomerase/epimerase
MKFAFSTEASEACLIEITATARKLGYDGVELSTTAPAATEFEPVGVNVACLAAGAMFSGQSKKDLSQSTQIRSLIDWAGRISCPLVMISEAAIPVGQNRTTAGAALSDWLLPLADYAADRTVTLALGNSQSLRSAKEIWTILDRLDHPSLGCCLNLYTAARLSEPPQVVVPMLNSKIVYVQVSDAKDLARPSECNLGDGVVPINTAISRLRGIGYSGWVTVGGGQMPQPAESILLQAISFLRQLSAPMQQRKTRNKHAR